MQRGRLVLVIKEYVREEVVDLCPAIPNRARKNPD